MTAHELTTIQRTFQQCLKDISIFGRFDTDGQFFEVNDIQKENRRWLVIAAGIEEAEADQLFSGYQRRAQDSLIPLKYRSTCRVCLLFILRPFDQELRYQKQTTLVSPFCSSRGIPWVEIRQAYVRIFDIPNNANKLQNIRWEWEIGPALQSPLEKNLQPWKDNCGFNPAHPPSHLHLNSIVYETNAHLKRETSDPETELRLAIGRPNPLAFLLSIAVWLQRL